MKKNIARTAVKTAIAILVLLILFVSAGVVYVWLNSEVPAEANKPIPQVIKDQPLKPRAPNPKNPVGASIQSIITPVKAGQNSSVTVHTTPTAKCVIDVSYNSVKSTDSGLSSKNADEFGIVTWSWTVPKSAPAGKWPVKITCQFNEKSAKVIGDLEVTN